MFVLENLQLPDIDHEKQITQGTIGLNGGARGSKTSMVTIRPSLQQGQISGSNPRRCRQTCFHESRGKVHLWLVGWPLCIVKPEVLSLFFLQTENRSGGF
jgi:hypothetical protein